MIRAPRQSVAWIATLLLLGMALTGCQEDMTWTVGNSDDDLKPKVSPEESFERIVDMFRRGVDTSTRGVPEGFVAHNSRRRSRLSVYNEVTDKVFPPSMPGQPYRARITVVSRYNYSFRHDAEDSADDSERSTNRRRSSNSTLPEDEPWLGGSEAGAFDDMNTAPSRNHALLDGIADEVITRHADEDERRYDLIYENGRWILMTQLDSETERAIANAFQYALDMQF